VSGTKTILITHVIVSISRSRWGMYGALFMLFLLKEPSCDSPITCYLLIG
jgi:hypothetical protein